jgi:hypothetical protein
MVAVGHVGAASRHAVEGVSAYTKVEKIPGASSARKAS